MYAGTDFCKTAKRAFAKEFSKKVTNSKADFKMAQKVQKQKLLVLSKRI